MHRTEQPTELRPGTILHDNYEICETVKSGGMGRIYKAKHIHFGKVCAIKQTFFAEPSQRHWFLHEALTLRSLTHKSLPKVTEYFCVEYNCYLVMEFIEGRDLMDILDDEGAVHPGTLVSWTIQVLEVLCYLHSKEPSRDPVIHRDIKPQNIKLDAEGNIFLLDFGLAKSGTQTIVPGPGTPAYSSPEQIRSLGTDARSDLFSLGATLYHLSTGELPESAYQRQSSIQQNETDPLKRADVLRPEIAPGLAAIIEKAMALESSARFNSATEMLRAVKEETAEAQVQRGARYVEQGEYDRALEALRQAALLDEKVADIYFWRAKAHAAKGQTELAIIECGKELEQNPRHVSAYLHRGNQHVRQGNFGLALVDFNSALGLNPKNADLYLSRGLTYKSIGDSERAAQDFRYALEFSSLNSKAQKESNLELQRLTKSDGSNLTHNDVSPPSSTERVSFPEGFNHLLIWSSVGVVIWSILSLTQFPPESEVAIYQKVFLFSAVLIILNGLLWRFAKPKVQFAAAILTLLVGVISLVNQWVKITKETELSVSESRKLADEFKGQANRLNDTLVVEEALRTGKEFWLIGIVKNLSGQAITYNVFNEDKTWQQRTLQPNQSEFLWKKGISITVRFNSGTEEKTYNLDASPVFDREPDQSAISRAPVNYFFNINQSPLGLYSIRPGRPQ